jgi:hypothetical protein
MFDPWFDPGWFATLYGSIGGALLGVLVGVAGGVGGSLARKGQRPAWVKRILTCVNVMGVASLALGVVALLCSQPWGIWGTLVVMGGLWVFAGRGSVQAHQQLDNGRSKSLITEPDSEHKPDIP